MMTCVRRAQEEDVDQKKAVSRSKAIDQDLARDKQRLKSQVQLLLLGRPRAGKTTLVRQLRVKNGHCLSQEETESGRTALLENLTDAMKTLLDVREELVQPWDSEVAEEEALTLTLTPLHRLLAQRGGWKGVTSMLIRLWHDQGVQAAWTHSSTLLGKFSPSTNDMMHIYRTTSGVDDVTVRGETAFRLVEMGGRSLTTPKLLSCFDNFSAVIFVAACCDVEQKIRHGLTTSGFQETGELFSLVTKNASLFKVPLILVITKLDILMEKSRLFDLRTVLPNLKGNPREEKDVQRCIVDVFRSKCADSRSFYHHFLTCTDMRSVQNVFSEIKRDIRDSLLRKLLPQ